MKKDYFIPSRHENFLFWQYNVADIAIPSKNGWYCTTTGVRYNFFFDYKNNRMFDPTPQEIAGREIALKGIELAESLGGQALTGTEKQRAWGEFIRYNILFAAKYPLDPEQISLILSTKVARTSKFWINMRKKHAFYVFNLCEKLSLTAAGDGGA